MARPHPTAADYSVVLNAPSGDNDRDIESLLFYWLNRRNLVALCGAGCSKDQLKYGDWKELARSSLNSLEAKDEVERARLKKYRARLKKYIDNNPQGYINLRTILNFLENHELSPGRESFRQSIQDRFRNTHNENRQKKVLGDIYQKLIDLDIKRFVTTNFDFEIEMALAGKHKVGINELLPDANAQLLSTLPMKLSSFRSGKSFSQVPDCMEQLSCFSLTRNEASAYMVFHCHGRFDHIESCILTEQDYSKWYLKDTPEVRAFRQTMEVLFGSNPLLVIGYSLNDPELGQILRTVHANRTNDTRRSPLFLLLYLAGSKDQQMDQCRALNEEYGAYVIRVSAEDGDTIEQAVNNKLDFLREGWQVWRDKIRDKPKVRSFMPAPAHKSLKYYHYLYSDVERVNQLIPTAAYDRLKEDIEGLIKIDKGVRCAALIAKAGTGKTWGMQRFGLEWLEDKKAHETPRRVFFWSTYYSNDLYNGLKRAIKFFLHDPPTHVQPDQILPLFQKVLTSTTDALLIFDGIGRLLKQSKDPTRDNGGDAGKAINRDVEKFFRMIIDNDGGAFVIVTSRRLPEMFAKAIGEGKVKLFNGMHVEDPDLLRKWDVNQQDKEGKETKEYFADPLNAGDYSPLRATSSECNWGALKMLSNRERMSLCAFLSGHLYSLRLVERILRFTRSDEERGIWLQSFMGKIASTPTDRRRERVIREAIEAADKRRSIYKRDHNLLERFIERVALFMSPVERPALETCLRLALKDQPLKSGALNKVISELRKSALLLEIKFNNIPEPGFTVHSLVQRYVRKHLHGSGVSVHPSMLLPGYTSDFDVIDPGSGRDLAKELFSSLCEDAVRTIAHKRTSRTLRDSGASVRAAFGVLRSRFCSNTVSRWGNYHEYLGMVYLLRDTAIKSTNGRWSEAETIDETSDIYEPGRKEPTNPPLYLGELAWLQNEAGLATYTEGNMLDAMFMRQQSSDINSLLDGKLPGFHRFQSYFNVGSVFIDMGNLLDAKRYLDDAMLIASAREDEGLRGRVLGYIGWLSYLRGNFEDAENDLRSALDMVRNNPRAKSVFHTFELHP